MKKIIMLIIVAYILGAMYFMGGFSERSQQIRQQEEKIHQMGQQTLQEYNRTKKLNEIQNAEFDKEFERRRASHEESTRRHEGY